MAYYTHVSRLAVMGFGLGYVKYQRNLYGADTVLNPLYAHRMHGAKLLVNLRYAGLHSARGDDIYRINPLIGAGLTGLLWGSQKELANKSSVNYYRLGPVQNYLGITVKAGIDIDLIGMPTVVATWSCFYQYNRVFNSNIQTAEHTIQVQFRLGFRIKRKENNGIPLQ